MSRRSESRIPQVVMQPAVLAIFKRMITLTYPRVAEAALAEIAAGRPPSTLFEEMERKGVFVDTNAGAVTEQATIDSFGNYIWTNTALSIRLADLIPGSVYNAKDAAALVPLITVRALNWLMSTLAGLVKGATLGEQIAPNSTPARLRGLPTSVLIPPNSWGSVSAAMRKILDVIDAKKAYNSGSFGIIVPADSSFMNSLAVERMTLTGQGGGVLAGLFEERIPVFGVSAVDHPKSSKSVVFVGRVRNKTPDDLLMLVPPRVFDENAQNSVDDYLTFTTVAGRDISDSVHDTITMFLESIVPPPMVPGPAGAGGAAGPLVRLTIDNMTIAHGIALGMFKAEEAEAHRIRMNQVNVGTTTTEAVHRAMLIKNIVIGSYSFPGGLIGVVPATVTTSAITVIPSMQMGILAAPPATRTDNDFREVMGIAASVVLGMQVHPVVGADAIIDKVYTPPGQVIRWMPGSLFSAVSAGGAENTFHKTLAPLPMSPLQPGGAQGAVDRMAFAAALLGTRHNNITVIGLPATADVTPATMSNAYLDGVARSKRVVAL